MEAILLLPIIIVVILLREAGFSWTSIMLLWDGILCVLYWLIYRACRKAENKPVSRKVKISYLAVAVLTLCLTTAVLMNETELAFYLSAVLPIFSFSLWFVVLVIRDDKTQ